MPPVATVPLGDGGARQASRSSQRRISACSLSDTAPYLSSAPSVVIVLPPPPSRCALLASRRHPASDGSWPSQLPPLPPPLACTRCANFIPRARVLTSSCRASFYDERTNVPAPPPPPGCRRAPRTDAPAPCAGPSTRSIDGRTCSPLGHRASSAGAPSAADHAKLLHGPPLQPSFTKGRTPPVYGWGRRAWGFGGGEAGGLTVGGRGKRREEEKRIKR